MGRKKQVEPFKSKYVVERSSYRLDHDRLIVHLRMLSPDAKHVDYVSYTIGRGYGQIVQHTEQNKILMIMESKMDKHVHKEKIEQLKKMAVYLDQLNKRK